MDIPNGYHIHVAQNFRGSLISRILRIFNRLRKYFNKNFWLAACSVCMQRIQEIISTNSSKIAIRKNLDPRKFSAIRYNKTYMAYMYNHAVQGNKKWFLTSFWAWCKQQQPCPSFEPSHTAHQPPCIATTVIQPMYIYVCDNYNSDLTSLHSWVCKMWINIHLLTWERLKVCT